MTILHSVVRQFLQDESAATAIEYGLIATLISIALITGSTALGSKLNKVFNGLATKMTTP